MTARLVLLRFEDHKEAEEFVRALEPDSDAMTDDLGNLVNDAHVEWVTAMPAEYCGCGASTRSSGRRTKITRRDRKSTEGWTKGRTFGWWVHPLCGGVGKMALDRWTAHMTNGAYDLKPKILGTDEVPNDTRQYEVQMSR